MDPAELDRWTVFDLNPTVEDWIDWASASGKVNEIVVDFIRQNREHLEHKDDFEPNKKYPSRRSWKRFNDVLEGASMFDQWTKEVRLIGLGFLGYEAAIAFSDYFENYDRQVSPGDIIDHGRFDRVKDYGLVDHISLIDKIDTTEAVQVDLDDNQIANLAKYFVTCPPEASMKLWNVIGKGKPENVVKIHQFDKDGIKVGKYFGELLTGKSPEGNNE